MGAWGLLNATMLVGLLGAALPVVIHLLNRRRDPVIDWGAMQFLELGRRERRRIRLTELLLMLARMGLLAAVALALARPFVAPTASGSRILATPIGFAGPTRDVVLVLDGSTSMGRVTGGTTARGRAIAWARRFVATLGPGDSVALVVAGDRVRPVLDPPVFDKTRAVAALEALDRSPPRGASDLPAALAEAFRILERGKNPRRDVVVLTDGQRSAWRPGETARWGLVRDLARRLDVPPRVWSTSFAPDRPDPDAPPNGAVGTPTVSRALLTPRLPLTVLSELTNAGPGALTRTAELLVDGRPAAGSAQVVGPVPEGGRAPLRFDTSLATPGSHLLTVKLSGDDPLPNDDEASTAVTVAAAIEVLLVDGETGREPLSGETDFLRAALAPTGDDTPRVLARVVAPERLDADALRGQGVLVLANVERLTPEQSSAVARFLEAGGGVLIAPGDRVDATAYEALPWMPARLGARVGSASSATAFSSRTVRQAVAHPAPASFTGAGLPPLAQGDAPPLASANLFTYRKIEVDPGASVAARLDTGDPWAVEGSRGRGRVLVLAGPLDAEGGTLPVNPDFVPLVHEWVLHLAGGAGPTTTRPGEPLVFDVPASGGDPSELRILTPSNLESKVATTRAGGRLRVRFDDTVESGVYRLKLPDPPGGFAYATVPADARESDPSRLEPAESSRLTEGWPEALTFESDPARLSARLLTLDGRPPRREVWRALVVLALCGLCVEIYLTRRLARGQGAAAEPEPRTS